MHLRSVNSLNLDTSARKSSLHLVMMLRFVGTRRTRLAHGHHDRLALIRLKPEHSIAADAFRQSASRVSRRRWR